MNVRFIGIVTVTVTNNGYDVVFTDVTQMSFTMTLNQTCVPEVADVGSQAYLQALAIFREVVSTPWQGANCLILEICRIVLCRVVKCNAKVFGDSGAMFSD